MYDQQQQEAYERSLKSEYFTGARIGTELAGFLDRHADECRAVADLITSDSTPVFLVGSGGSYANCEGAKYLWDAITSQHVEALASYELVWRAPKSLGPGAVVVLNSLSGETEDTLTALRAAKAAGARTVALVRQADTTLGREADVTIEYDHYFCYEGPVVAMMLMAAEVARRRGDAAAADALDASLQAVPAITAKAVSAKLEVAEAEARAFLSSTHLYVIGAGPLYSLAYKVGLTVVMENIRIGATACDASEFRHGPAEAMERLRPDMMFLVGTDASREMSQRTLAFCEQNGARALVLDAADYGEVHPLLTGLVLNSLTQCFVVHSAILRGILDLDARVFMGHSVLAAGGAGWP